MGQTHGRVPGLLNKRAKKTPSSHLKSGFLKLLSSNVVYLLSSERVSKPQRKHAGPRTGKARTDGGLVPLRGPSASL